MSNSDASADLRSTFVVVNRGLQADTIAVTDSIWSDLDRKFGDFAGHILIAHSVLMTTGRRGKFIRTETKWSA
jgi:hypothetical protein